MTNSQAKSELMQIYMSLSEEKKKALDVAFKAMEYDDAKYHEEHGEVIVDKAVWEDAKRALEQEPSGDTVSRQAVNDLVDELARAISDERCCISRGRSTATIMRDIHNLPSAEKTGHWRAVYQGDEIINYRCSECEFGDTNGSTNLYGWDYCRRCGARMVEPQEGEVKNEQR